MNPNQLAAYMRMTDHSAKAGYLVQIGAARDFSDACSQIAKRRATFQRERAIRQKERKARDAAAMEERVRRANLYFD